MLSLRHIEQETPSHPTLQTYVAEKQSWFIIIPYVEKNNNNWWPLTHIHLLYHTSHDIKEQQTDTVCRMADSQ